MEHSRRWELRRLAATSWSELHLTPTWGIWGRTTTARIPENGQNHHWQSTDGYGFDNTSHAFQPASGEFYGIIPFMIKLIQICLFLCCWILAAAFSYVVFYRCMMPREAVARSFTFDYYYPPDHSMSHFKSEMAIEQWNSYLTFRESATSAPYLTEPSTPPFTLIDLFARHNFWTAFQSEVEPSPVTKDRILEPKQSYYVDILLELPDSLVNQQIGIFGVVVELYSASKNKTLLAVARSSARLPHESRWISVVRKIVLLPALLLGALEESRTVLVSSFRHFTESMERPLQFVSICILGHKANVEINKAWIRIGEELTYIQESLKQWYYTCFFIGTITFMVFYAVVWKVGIALKNYFFQLAFTMQEPPCDLDLEDDGIFYDPIDDPQQQDLSEEQVNGDYTDLSHERNYTANENPEPHHELPTDFDDFSRGSWEDIPNQPVQNNS